MSKTKNIKDFFSRTLKEPIQLELFTLWNDKITIILEYTDTVTYYVISGRELKKYTE